MGSLEMIGFQLNMHDDDAYIYNAYSFLQAGLGSEGVKEHKPYGV